MILFVNDNRGILFLTVYERISDFIKIVYLQAEEYINQRIKTTPAK